MSRDSQAGKESRTQRNTDNPRSGRRQGEPSLSLSEKAAHNDQEEVIQIPENKVGHVIGRKGKKKRDIMERSGVQALDIKDCQVRITGTEEQRTKAKTLIYRILSVRHSKSPFYHSFTFIHPLHIFMATCFPDLLWAACLPIRLSVCQPLCLPAIVQRSGVQEVVIKQEHKNSAPKLIVLFYHSFIFIRPLPVFISLNLPVSFLFVCFSVCQFVCLSVSVYLSVNLPVCLSVSQSVCLSVCLSVCRPPFLLPLPVTRPPLLRYTTHNFSIRFYEGLTLKPSAFESLYGDQFTFPTQLIEANYPLYYDLVAKFWA